MEVIETARGQDAIAYQGYVYTKEKKQKKTIHWRCQDRKCLGRTCTGLDYHKLSKVVVRKPHNHPPTPESVSVSKNRSKRRALERKRAKIRLSVSKDWRSILCIEHIGRQDVLHPVIHPKVED
eukprot:Platyproteum_vivax@DN4434_c0_g1_i1.p1